jgi:hypothetical protein
MLSVDWTGVGEALVRAMRKVRRPTSKARCVLTLIIVLVIQWWRQTDVQRERCYSVAGHHLLLYLPRIQASIFALRSTGIAMISD